MNLPIPEHLENSLLLSPEVSNHYKINGHVKCTCGCTNFKIEYAGEEDSSGDFVSSLNLEEHPYPEYRDYYVLAIKITCHDCQNKLYLYDRHRHGWNGYVAANGNAFEFIDTLLQPKKCIKCSQSNFNITVTIFSQGKADFIENAPELPEDKWVNAFEGIALDIKCCDCNHTQINWLNDECM